MPTPDAPIPNAIEVSGLSVVFGEGSARNVAVDRISFNVPAGGSFGLVGESGSGKTTVIRAIAGLLQAWSGATAIAGRDVGRPPRRGLHRRPPGHVRLAGVGTGYRRHKGALDSARFFVPGPYFQSLGHQPSQVPGRAVVVLVAEIIDEPGV